MPYRRFPSRRRLVAAALGAMSVLLSSCDEGAGGPAADVSVELSGGSGAFIGSTAMQRMPPGYVEVEYLASGMASDYVPVNAQFDDGRWELTPSTTAEYRTRVLVRRPIDPASASGTVIVEWLNVSGGVDADAEYGSLEEEIARQGHIWVGVSAQLIGVEGGPVLVGLGGANDVAGKGLKGIDPTRYGSLSHPGDGYAFDIFTQVARAVRHGDLLGGARARVIIAAGESQSAMALTTYYDGVQPLTRAFDAFFIHSRGSFALPMVQPGEAADLVRAIVSIEQPRFRDDLDAPVLDIQTEGDTVGLLQSAVVRQPDSETFRLWEVAGTAHADRHLLGPAAASVDCTVPVNDGPMHVVAKAALRALDVWARTGRAPPSAPRLDISFDDSGLPSIRRDADGIALAGIRTPPVDVPVDVLSGVPASASVLCLLLGSTTPLTDVRIAALYASRAEYQQRFEASASDAIQAGYVLEDDRAALLAYEQPLRVAP